MGYVLFSSKTVVARTDHECCLCGLVIAKGESHYTQRGVFEEMIQTIHAHLECQEVTSAWTDDDWVHQDTREFRRELEAYRKTKEQAATPTMSEMLVATEEFCTTPNHPDDPKPKEVTT